MRTPMFFVPVLLSLPPVAAAAPGDAYQAGYRLGQAIGQAMPYVLAGAAVLAIGWLVRSLLRRRRTRTGTRPEERS